MNPTKPLSNVKELLFIVSSILNLIGICRSLITITTDGSVWCALLSSLWQSGRCRFWIVSVLTGNSSVAASCPTTNFCTRARQRRFAFCLLVGLLVLLPRIVVFYVFHHCWWEAQLFWAVLQGCISRSTSCNQRDLLMCAAVMGCSSSSTLRNARAYLVLTLCKWCRLSDKAQRFTLQWCALRKKRRGMVLVRLFGT